MITAVGHVIYETVGLPAPHHGVVNISPLDLAKGAATVGVSPLSAGPPRTFAELLWRINIVRANLAVDAATSRWVRSPSYNRLDPSEKSAVSYFLGLTQARVMCEQLLGVDYLVHLDTLLLPAGQPRRRVRPDLVGYSISQMRSVAVEAKGRTNGHTARLVRGAKNQARNLPQVNLPNSPGRGAYLPIASVSWFDSDGSWHSRLEDPPGVEGSKIPWQVVATQFYRPLATALKDAQELRIARTDDNGVSVPLPGGLTLTMARPISDTVLRLEPVWPDGDLASQGIALKDAFLAVSESPIEAPLQAVVASWTKDHALAVYASTNPPGW